MGYLCAKHPFIVIAVGISFCCVLIGGFYFFTVVTDPVELWSPVDSNIRKNKIYYDTHFRPFYRTSQIIIRPTNTTPFQRKIDNSTSKQYSNAFNKDFLMQVFYLQSNLTLLKAEYNNTNVTLNEICFKPLQPDYDTCLVISIFGYWQNNFVTFNKFNDYLSHFESCVASPTTLNDPQGLSCFSDYGGFIQPDLSLGGYPTKEYGNATALIITFIINNNIDPVRNLKAKAWEKKTIDFLKSYSTSNTQLKISFNTERSIEDELDRSTQSDIKTILISYIAMFIYITLTLGSYNLFPFRNRQFIKGLQGLLVDMKLTLALAGIAIVLLSITASIGLFSYFRVEATLIIFEVIPFLVLAVGIDNIFILVQSYQRDNRFKNESLESQISRIVGRVGPSMLLTSSAESLAFLLGVLTPMPAVKIFSLYASLAVFIDFILQITCFVSLMTLDCRRELANRYNVICCFKNKYSIQVGYFK